MPWSSALSGNQLFVIRHSSADRHRDRGGSDARSGRIRTATSRRRSTSSTLYFRNTGSGGPVTSHGYDDTRTEDGKRHRATYSSRRPTPPAQATRSSPADKVYSGKVVSTRRGHSSEFGLGVRFNGKPPKGLQQGDWYVARTVGETDLTAIKVLARPRRGRRLLRPFCPPPPSPDAETEFFGPMTRELRPLDYDRSPTTRSSAASAPLTGLSEAARNLVKPGRTVLVVHERNDVKEAAHSATIAGGRSRSRRRLRMVLDSETDFTGWEKGWTTST